MPDECYFRVGVKGRSNPHNDPPEIVDIGSIATTYTPAWEVDTINIVCVGECVHKFSVIKGTRPCAVNNDDRRKTREYGRILTKNVYSIYPFACYPEIDGGFSII